MEPKIMLVDDDADFLRVLSAKIRKLSSMEVITETDPHQAIEKLKEQNISFVITDINMPEMNGVELLLGVHSLLKGIQVVIITAGTTAENYLDGFRYGAFDFLDKPVDDQQLEIVLKKMTAHFERWEAFVESHQT